jgi:transcriptional regulator with XRE-family HTH domain
VVLMTTGQRPTLADVVGQNLKRIRESKRLTQTDLAAALSRVGLRIQRGAIAVMEAGGRSLELTELILLTEVLDISIMDLLSGETGVSLNEGAIASLNHVRFRVTGIGPKDGVGYFGRANPAATLSDGIAGQIKIAMVEAVNRGDDVQAAADASIADLKRKYPDDQESVRVAVLGILSEFLGPVTSEQRERFKDLSDELIHYADLASLGESERRAAQKMGISVDLLVVTAMELWGRSLHHERDARVAEKTDMTGLSMRQIQAFRGHETRQLIVEIQDALRKGE